MIYKNDPAELPVVDAPSYWDSSEKDYRKVQNLIRGLMPRITAGDEEDITAAGLIRSRNAACSPTERYRRRSTMTNGTGSSLPVDCRAM